MYTRAHVDRVRALRADGANVSEIARAVGVSRSTVRSWLDGTPAWLTETAGDACPECAVWQRALGSAPAYAYLLGYLLGIYLGDGHITQAARAQRLRVASTKRYPRIIAETRTAMTIVSGRPIGLLWTTAMSR